MLCFKQCIDSYFLIAACCLNKSKIVVILLTLNNSKNFATKLKEKLTTFYFELLRIIYHMLLGPVAKWIKHVAVNVLAYREESSNHA